MQNFIHIVGAIYEIRDVYIPYTYVYITITHLIVLLDRRIPIPFLFNTMIILFPKPAGLL